ncbi:hypothetical protein M0812_15912 [Anaeramoeba flamelloides]|uniref:Nudix hydrolase domain-containing protein n=1 Tax=Anaeramoeba flamelloides TaxID=1746091 RepID=A0AAV7ZD01_9EUKA|nr:hypothetical protein M0812_15912 [Anaeramoeba flamelloides]
MITDKDNYQGVTITIPKEWNNEKEFSKKFGELMSTLIEQKTRGVWCKVSPSSSRVIPVLIEEHSFAFHHATPDYLMLNKWLPKDERNNLPNYAFTFVGVGGFVQNDQGQVLLIKERFKPRKFPHKWKFPGGLLDRGESIVEGAMREVFEETGIKTEPISIIPWMSHKTHLEYRFGCSDIYWIVRLKPLTTKITTDNQEIKNCKWFDLEEVIDPEVENMYQFFKGLVKSATKHPEYDIQFTNRTFKNWYSYYLPYPGNENEKEKENKKETKEIDNKKKNTKNNEIEIEKEQKKN